MFSAIIDSASLKNPIVLNKFKKRKVTVSYEPESTVNKYHYNFLLEIESAEIEDAILKFQKEMQSGWYSFFWNNSSLYIVFNTGKFKIDLPGGWNSDVYKRAREFGNSQNIPEEYLDFKKYFQALQK